MMGDSMDYTRESLDGTLNQHRHTLHEKIDRAYASSASKEKMHSLYDELSKTIESFESPLNLNRKSDDDSSHLERIKIEYEKLSFAYNELKYAYTHDVEELQKKYEELLTEQLKLKWNHSASRAELRENELSYPANGGCENELNKQVRINSRKPEKLTRIQTKNTRVKSRLSNHLRSHNKTHYSKNPHSRSQGCFHSSEPNKESSCERCFFGHKHSWASPASSKLC